MTAPSPSPPVAGPRRQPPANPLFEYLLRLADDRLVLGHRLSEWCGHGPILEEDIALTNIALDLVGHASMLYALAGATEGAGRDEDALAYFRGETDYRNAQLAELPCGDFAVTTVRQFLFDAYSVPLWSALQRCGHTKLAAIAAKALKEDTYHLRHSTDWMLKLGDGTAESHQRTQHALDTLWRFTGELFETDEVHAAVARDGIEVDSGALLATWRRTVAAVVAQATLELPPDGAMATGGRRGVHTEHLGHMLSDMQIVARSHPGAQW